MHTEKAVKESRIGSAAMLAAAAVATIATVGFGLAMTVFTAPLATTLAAVGMGASSMIGIGCGYIGYKGLQEAQMQVSAEEDFTRTTKNPETAAAMNQAMGAVGRNTSAPEVKRDNWQAYTNDSKQAQPLQK